MYALLGGISLGLFTGPTAHSETEKSTFPKHNVAEGKPVPQDVGDELDTKKLSFFFDEGFCDPLAELARLRSARASRRPLAFVPGDGNYTGARYLIESIDITTKRTTPHGRVTRLEASLSLSECPVQDLAGLASTIARGLAAGISALSGLNTQVRK